MEAKGRFDHNHAGYRFTLARCGFELPIAYGVHGRLIQTKRHSTNNLGFYRASPLGNGYLQNHGAIELGFSSRIGVVRLRTVRTPRRSDPAHSGSDDQRDRGRVGRRNCFGEGINRVKISVRIRIRKRRIPQQGLTSPFRTSVRSPGRARTRPGPRLYHSGRPWRPVVSRASGWPFHC